MPSYSKAEILRALNDQCRECNDVHGAWHAGNDCTGKSCPLYPYRPGDGPGHAERLKKAIRSTVGLRRARASKAETPAVASVQGGR